MQTSKINGVRFTSLRIAARQPSAACAIPSIVFEYSRPRQPRAAIGETANL